MLMVTVKLRYIKELVHYLLQINKPYKTKKQANIINVKYKHPAIDINIQYVPFAPMLNII